MKNRNTTIISITILLVLACFGLLLKAQAVVPAPDGGYPGGNTAEGQNALLSLNVNTGTNNTAVGWFSLKSNVGGQYNTAVGSGALFNNTASRNTAVGGAAMFSNTSGSFNTAVGMLSLFTNSTGSSNTAVGDGALFTNSTGSSNTAIGRVALLSNTTGGGNVATGAQALVSNTTGGQNTAYGYQAMLDNTIGEDNAAVGFGALGSNTSGIENTAVGISALANNTAGNGNTAIGAHALEESIDGDINIALGRNAGLNVSTASNVICIGALGANVTASCYIDNIWSKPGGSQAVYVNSDGKLGALVSSRRFKDDIKPINQASEVIYGLRPVSFRYKSEIEPARPLAFGLIAEEVEKINPDLVSRDKDGKPLTVRYDQVNAMLLNEFLKEQKKVQEQEATIAQLKQEIETVVARLKEHDSRIQKVSAQIEVGKAVGQTALNNR
jgi:hypothetical protein